MSGGTSAAISKELYGLEASPDLISLVTDAVLDQVREWRSRALHAGYPW